MASNVTMLEADRFEPSPRGSRRASPNPVLYALSALASLKLTVVLFSLAILLIFFGTLAQVDRDIWDVMRYYFRTFVATVDFQIFFHRSIVVGGWFPFPGGWTIGGLMLVNLLAAHLVRFRVQAGGGRLLLGGLVILLGMGVTWLVIASGSNKQGFEGEPILSWDEVWLLFKGGMVAAWLGTLAGLVMLGRERRAEFWALLAGSAMLGALTAWLLVSHDVAPDYSSMRILWQLLKGTVAGVVLLAGCVLAFGKRAGIVLLHGGIGLMMFSELWVDQMATEAQIHVAEGETVNFAQDIRSVELAIVDSSPEDHDVVTVIPGHQLYDGKTLAGGPLPFHVEVRGYLPNSEVVRLTSQTGNLATQGLGLKAQALPKARSAGTDSDSKVDMPSVYVTLRDAESKELGTWLLSTWWADPEFAQQVTVGEKTYDLYLRFKRDYKPYAVHLVDVRADMYPGTATPKNYSSDIRLLDPSRQVDRDVRIWMNNPLRYAGETFYQSNYFRDPRTGQESTGLQVVTNTGWMIPYVACMIVVVGMLYQFSLTLLRYARRREEGRLAQLADRASARPGHRAAEVDVVGWVVPIVAALVAAVYLIQPAREPIVGRDEFDLYAFGKLPAMHEGRVQPLDTLARNSLRVISGRDEFRDEEGAKQPAIRWLADVFARPGTAAQYKVVRIDNLELLAMLHLEPRGGWLYSMKEIQPRLHEFEQEADRAAERKAAKEPLSAYEVKLLDLHNRLNIYYRLAVGAQLPTIRADHAREDLMAAMEQQRYVSERVKPPLVVPPAEADGKWDWFGSAWFRAWAERAVQGTEIPLAVSAMTDLTDAYAAGRTSDFNRRVYEYAEVLAAVPPLDYNPAKVRFESLFNHMAPFYHSAVMYLIAFVLTMVGVLTGSRTVNRTAFAVIAVTFLLHTFAIVGRIYISGRPPVTNLYSSAVFVGFACVAAGLIVEKLSRIGAGNAVASVAGFSTLLIAHYLAGDGDTFTVLQAVLDTQFWLATHVVCITLGYAATYVAGLLGIYYVLAGFVAPPHKASAGKVLANMIYGTLCFALLLSFFGTVLGGLWADDSWGRFWGWDPKENGALIIVLWNALVLHARWDGMVRDRGLAVLAIGGNIATSWSWFGVNQLGVGLHAYGFTSGVTIALLVFAVSQVLLITLGCVAANHLWVGEKPRTGTAYRF